MKKNLTIVVFPMLLVSNIYTQAPAIQWQKTLGGTGNDQARSVQITADGGYVIAGFSNSNDGDVSGNNGGFDCWVVKSDANGDVQWQKPLGGTGYDIARSIQPTTDGGYVVAGLSSSDDGDVSENQGFNDFWVVKLDSIGSIQWQKSLGGTDEDFVRSIQPTADGGYIVAGSTDSNDGDVSGHHGGIADSWVVKLDDAGAIQWQKSLGGTGYDDAHCIRPTSDGGYVLSGTSSSNDGDVSGNHGGYDCWVVKLDAAGDIQWQKSLGGTGYDDALSIQTTTDGGYIMAGYTRSNDGDVSGNHGLYDCWVVKLDVAGDIQWQKTLGGTGNDQAYSIQTTTDGGYTVAGFTESNDGDVSNNFGHRDFWILKLGTTGDVQWQKTLGGSGSEEASSIYPTADGGYVIAGQSNSNNGDVSGNHGGTDCWLVKLAPTVSTHHVLIGSSMLLTYPNPSTDWLTISLDGDYMIHGYSFSEPSGRIVTNVCLNQPLKQTEVSLGTMPKGVYFLEVRSDERVFSQKIIVQ